MIVMIRSLMGFSSRERLRDQNKKQPNFAHCESCAKFGRFSSQKTYRGLLRLLDLLDQEYALLVGRDDIEQAIAVEVENHELGTDAALIVDQTRSERDLAVGALGRLEP